MKNSHSQSKRTGTQGWQSCLASKQELLYQYNLSKKYSSSHTVETFHGNVAEAVFRKYLENFLPKKYGVTSGYIISQGKKDTEKMPHFDVIIYNQLDSPILWIEENPDSSHQGKSMAIPAEHVVGVIEVKASLTISHAKKAMKKIQELQPLMDLDPPNERYKKFLPPNFFCACIFFELRKKDKKNKTLLNHLIPNEALRGFYGGMVLEGEGMEPDATGQIQVCIGDKPIKAIANEGKAFGMSASKKIESKHISTMISWTDTGFSIFMHDIVAILNGSFEPGRLSSFHGISYLNSN